MNSLDRYLEDAMAFRQEQLILEDGRRLGDALERWQHENIFAPLDVKQQDGRYRYRLAYLELPRGHAKTTMIGGEAVTQLTLAGRNWRGHIAAGDREQARELFDAAAGFIRRNRYLEPAFDIRRDRILATHTGASLRLHSADAPTAHGLIVDWFAVDEFWNQPNRQLFDAFYTASVKRPDWRGVLLTTAGFDKNTICWEVRELAQQRDDFYAFIAPGRLASWITDEEVERMRETLPAHIFQRFVENKWVEGSGSFITREDLRRCVDDRLFPRSTAIAGSPYYVAIDLGLKKDRTAGAVVHRVDPDHNRAAAEAHLPIGATGFVVLDEMRVWEGSRRHPVSIAEVEDWIASAIERFRPRRVLIDPWQAQATRQRFGGLIEEFTFSAQSVAKLSVTLYRLLQSGTLRLFPDRDLERELVELQAVQTSYGWRIDHARNKHDDRAMALAMAATAALEDKAPSRPTRIRKAIVGNGSVGGVVTRFGDKVVYVDRDGELAWRRARG